MNDKVKTLDEQEKQKKASVEKKAKEAKENQKDKTVKKCFLKLNRWHPNGFMRLGRHQVLQNEFKEFELNAKEAKYLETEGGKAWFLDEEDKEEKAKPIKKPSNRRVVKL